MQHMLRYIYVHLSIVLVVIDPIFSINKFEEKLFAAIATVALIRKRICHYKRENYHNYINNIAYGLLQSYSSILRSSFANSTLFSFFRVLRIRSERKKCERLAIMWALYYYNMPIHCDKHNGHSITVESGFFRTFSAISLHRQNVMIFNFSLLIFRQVLFSFFSSWANFHIIAIFAIIICLAAFKFCSVAVSEQEIVTYWKIRRNLKHANEEMRN